MRYPKDPVCGMPVPDGTGVAAQHEGRVYQFCSRLCLERFLEHPERYAAAAERESGLASAQDARIAYFSMEVAADPRLPTYSGGLGVLAGDTLRSCADLGVPMVGVTLLHRKGYFEQDLDASGQQHERPVQWSPEAMLEPMEARAAFEIEGRRVALRAWRHLIRGAMGRIVPLFLLDADLTENDERDRHLTDYLYGGDARYRLAQEVILGIGGVRMLQALGFASIQKVHLNEGHAALAALELLGARQEWDFAGVRSRCIFTTHTPVAAGHDRFGYDLVDQVLRGSIPRSVLEMLGGSDCLNMTALALNLSGYVNGVARKHQEVSAAMFPGYAIHQITNGVHSATWTCESFQALYDRFLPGWANDPSMLRQAIGLPSDDIWQAHMQAKAHLLEIVRQRTGRQLSPDRLTVGFARRATQYKRADLVLADPDRLLSIAERVGPVQFVFAGKAHPQDEPGKEVIRHIHAVARRLGDAVPIVYLENYDLALGRAITAGADLWLNTPQPPLEASGTSGMKAAHNGVPSLSVLDGWWIEGHLEGVTGWSVESSPLDKLETRILPLFYGDRAGWIAVMKHAIALNASFFNTHRMVQQYVTNAWF